MTKTEAAKEIRATRELARIQLNTLSASVEKLDTLRIDLAHQNGHRVHIVENEQKILRDLLGDFRVMLETFTNVTRPPKPKGKTE